MGQPVKVSVVKFGAARQPSTYGSALSNMQEWPIPFRPALVQSASRVDERGSQAQAVSAKWNSLCKEEREEARQLRKAHREERQTLLRPPRA